MQGIRCPILRNVQRKALQLDKSRQWTHLKSLLFFAQLTKLGLKSIKHRTNSLPFYPSKGDLLNGA